MGRGGKDNACVCVYIGMLGRKHRGIGGVRGKKNGKREANHWGSRPGPATLSCLVISSQTWKYLCLCAFVCILAVARETK